MSAYLSFKSFFLSEAKLVSSGVKGEYDANKYIKPFVKGAEQHAPNSHEIGADVGDFKAGDKVTLHSHHVDESGIHHVVISTEGSKTKTAVPISKIKKMTTQRNRGFENEGSLTKHLNKHGLMQGGGAGATAGNDFHLIDKRKESKERKIRGSAGISTPQSMVNGEHKSNKSAAFGQITLTRHPTTGKWHISAEARKKRPEYAAHVEAATIDGKKKLLTHLNETQPKDYKPKGKSRADDIFSADTSLAPAHAYMRDHHVDVLHLDSHGTYRAGMSENKDRHKLGLPKLEGTGRFRVRQKHSEDSRTVQFNIRDLSKSDVNIGTDEGAGVMKKKLGHI